MIPGADPKSQTWLALRDWIDARIADRQRKLEAHLTEHETAVTRGEIAELRNIVKKAEQQNPTGAAGPQSPAAPR